MNSSQLAKQARHSIATHCPPWRLSFCVVIGVIMLGHGLVQAAEDRSPIDKSSAQAHAKAWQEFYGGRLDEAIRTVSRFANSKHQELLFDNFHLQARANWEKGDPSSKRKALQLWGRLKRWQREPTARARLGIAEALNLHSRGKTAESLKVLKKIANDQELSWVAIEATIEIASQTRASSKDAESMAAIKHGDQLLKHAESLGVPKPLAEVYRNAIKSQRQYLADKGKEAFEKAEHLRRLEQFPRAIPAFKQIAEDFPNSKYRHRAQLHIAYCMIGQRKYDAAADWLETFIGERPSGPWRGQAYLALIDLNVEQLGDLSKASTFLKLSLETVAKAAKDEKSARSWALATPDLHIRNCVLGILSRQALENAESLSKSVAALNADKRYKSSAGRIASLLRFIRQDGVLVPKEITQSDSALAVDLATAAGFVYVLAGRFEHGERILEAVTKRRYSATKRHHYSIALTGLGLIAQARNESDEAIHQLKLAIRQAPDGSWHDHSHFGIASIVGHTDGPPFSRQAKALRADSISHLSTVLNEFPASIHRQAAMIRLVDLYSSLESWAAAVDAGTRYLNEFPETDQVGRICIKMIDVSLERLFDIEQAEKMVMVSRRWLALDLPSPKKRDRYDLLLRAGVIAYVRQQYDTATLSFRTAKSLDEPVSANKNVAGSAPPTIDVLIQLAQSKERLTPEVVLGGDARTQLILQIADIYNQAGRRDEAHTLYTRLIKHEELQMTPMQKSWAHYQRAQAMHADRGSSSARDDYLQAHRSYPAAEWAPRAAFYGATILSNRSKDRTLANDEFLALAAAHPDHPLAAKSLYMVGVNFEWSRQWVESKRAYTTFLKRYPESEWAQVVRKHHMKNVDSKLDGTGKQ